MGELNQLKQLMENNQAWAARMLARDSEFFKRLLGQQRPEYLWIGCSDSRVPANEIVGLRPGELFVHRNVANAVIHADLNCLSVLQFSVEVLRVKHIIVCGHYGCGGVLAALRGDRLGLVDEWLRSVVYVREKNEAQIEQIASETDRHDRLCELNVIEQVANVCRTTVLQDAWARSQEITVHGWIYGLENGLLHDLGMCVSSEAELNELYRAARARKGPRRE